MFNSNIIRILVMLNKKRNIYKHITFIKMKTLIQHMGLNQSRFSWVGNCAIRKSDNRLPYTKLGDIIFE